jgi:hypothetical protein
MFANKLKHLLLTLVVTAGLLAVAGPASAGVVTDNKDPDAFAVDMGTSEALHGIVYNGHAGLGANWATPEVDANANAVFSGDAYDNEMGIVPPARPSCGRSAGC